MEESISDRRMAENEVVFREANQSIQKGFEELARIAREDDQHDLAPPFDQPLHFYCECSDENCRQRIIMKPSLYDELHKKSNQFIVIPGHQHGKIERVMQETDDYYVVEKFMTPPESASQLNPTDIDNS